MKGKLPSIAEPEFLSSFYIWTFQSTQSILFTEKKKVIYSSYNCCKEML